MWQISDSEQAAEDQVQDLSDRLKQFYNSYEDYPVFITTPDHTGWYVSFLDYIKPGDTILELGAGKTTFGDFAKSHKQEIEFHTQDITDINSQWLSEHSDKAWICDIDQINECKYDLIFSTFVIEHLVEPEKFLEAVDKLLKPGGIHIVLGPNYDYPGYLCPSLRHYNNVKKFLICIYLTLFNIARLFRKKAVFLVNYDPAVLHCSWYRDADACHIVSRMGMRKWFKANGYRVETVGFGGKRIVDRLYRKFFVLKLACVKR